MLFFKLAFLGAFATFVMKALSKTITADWFVLTRIIVSWATFILVAIGMFSFIF